MEESFKLIREYNEKYHPDWKETLDVYLSNALAGEVGELCNEVKHYYGGGSKGKITDSKDRFFIECADIFIYLSVFLMKNGIEAEQFKEIIKMKMERKKNRLKKRNLEVQIYQEKKNENQAHVLKLLDTKPRKQY